jgi:hypothetical protein
VQALGHMSFVDVVFRSIPCVLCAQTCQRITVGRDPQLTGNPTIMTISGSRVVEDAWIPRAVNFAQLVFGNSHSSLCFSVYCQCVQCNFSMYDR